MKRIIAIEWWTNSFGYLLKNYVSVKVSPDDFATDYADDYDDDYDDYDDDDFDEDDPDYEDYPSSDDVYV